MPIPVITVAQMRDWERATWASGQTEEAVMRRVGQVIAQRIEQLTRPGDFVLVFAGKGHNGDDAKYAAEYTAGREVQVLRVLEPETALREAQPMLARHPALIIDGLFGIGLNRPLAANWIQLIQQINQTGLPVLAVDVPSGLNAETGLPLEDAIRATITVTLGAVKAGLLQESAWPFVGRLEVAPEIGLVPYPFSTELNYVVPQDFPGFPPRRPPAGHKGTFGHLIIIAGSSGYHGAAVLTARGAQRAQPGLITLITSESVYLPVAAQLQSTMVRRGTGDLSLPRTCTAIFAGPGLASEEVSDGLKEAVRSFWRESPLPVIIDASALAWLPAGPCPEGSLRVITPHPGEAARLLETTTAEVQKNRPQAVRKLSRRFGNCHVVLKGHQTIIGRQQGTLLVNSSGNAYLGQGGSGDLLGGYLSGLLAQPTLQADPGQTVRFAIWQHGAAADALLATRPNWTIEDLAAALGSVHGEAEEATSAWEI